MKFLRVMGAFLQEFLFSRLKCNVIVMLGYRLKQQARISQEDNVQVQEVVLLSIHISLAKEVVGDAEVVVDGDAVVDSDRPRQGLDAYISPSPARRYRGHLRRGGSSSPTDEDPDGSLLQSALGWGGEEVDGW